MKGIAMSNNTAETKDFPHLMTHAELCALPGEEDVTLRTACAKVYTLGDGHYQAVVFA